MKRLFLVLFFTVVMVSSVSAQSTLAFQEKCAGGAKKFVLGTGGCDQMSERCSHLSPGASQGAVKRFEKSLSETKQEENKVIEMRKPG